MVADRLTLAEYARAMSSHYSTLYDRVRASERRGGHGIQTRDEEAVQKGLENSVSGHPSGQAAKGGAT